MTYDHSLEPKCVQIVILFRLRFFRAAHRWVAHGFSLLLKICHAYLAMTKLGTDIPYPKTIQKIYESRDTPLQIY